MRHKGAIAYSGALSDESALAEDTSGNYSVRENIGAILNDDAAAMRHLAYLLPEAGGLKAFRADDTAGADAHGRADRDATLDNHIRLDDAVCSNIHIVRGNHGRRMHTR